MSDAPNILSPSFPHGLTGLRSEEEFRESRNATRSLEVKYCEDCRFYVASLDVNNSRCSRPRETQAIELVARAAVAPKYFCDLQRGSSDNDACGANAKFFQAKIAEAAE